MRRQAILEGLHRRIATGKAILAAGCSAGIIARSAEEAGADLIVVYSTGKSRLMGLPTWRFGDSNQGTLEMAAEILNVVKSTPVIGGVEANDPTRKDLDTLLDRFQAAGFDGVINFPTLTNMPDQRRRAEMVATASDVRWTPSAWPVLATSSPWPTSPAPRMQPQWQPRERT